VTFLPFFYSRAAASLTELFRVGVVVGGTFFEFSILFDLFPIFIVVVGETFFQISLLLLGQPIFKKLYG